LRKQLEKRNIYKPVRLILGIGLIFLTFSCKTYHITPESFKTQMIEAKTENLKEVEINNPLFYYNIQYSSNDIESLIVIDKNGNEIILENSPSIEMKVTHRNGKNYYFYFDTVILENDTLIGGRSRFAQNLIRKIPMDSILRIEIQEGGKKFEYQD